MSEELAGFQRKALRGMAHDLDPAVLVGQAGLSENVLSSIEAALDAHELIKVRFVDHKESKREFTEKIVEACSAHLAGMVGHVAILYRPHPDPQKRRIVLPRRSSASPDSGR
jgi:RNA-binding protein